MTQEHVKKSVPQEQLQEHENITHTSKLPQSNKLRHQESLWLEYLQSGGNPRTTTPTGARGEPRSSKLPQGIAGGGDARRQRKETASQPEEPVMKRSQRKIQSQIAEMEHRGEELGRRRVEDPRESPLS